MPIPTRSASLRDPRKQVSPFVYPLANSPQLSHAFIVPPLPCQQLHTEPMLITKDSKYSTTYHETLYSTTRHGKPDQGVCPRDE